MKTDIFHLQIIPIEDILPHEMYDPSRAHPLSAKIKKENMFTNPIIVAQIDGKKYMQLDGMNRFSAFKSLGFKSILCQIIDYNDQEGVELSSWSHLFSGNKDDFLKHISSNNDISITKGKIDNIGYRYIKEEGQGRLCTFITNDGSVNLINSNGNLEEKLDNLNFLVKYYEKQISRDILPTHTNSSDVEFLFKEHPGSSMILVFPTFTRHQIVDLVKKGKLFPSGITRHIIKRRCLHLNIPLTLFDVNKTVEDQNEELEKNLSCREFRVYEEPTVYFE